MAKGRVRRPRVVSAVLLALGLAGGVGAQPVSSAHPPEDLFVPGGLDRLFHAAGLEPPRDRAYALLTLARLIYEEPVGSSLEQDAKAAQLREYLDVVGQWCIRAAPFGKGIALREAQSRATRGQLEDVLAFVGLGLRQSGGKWLAESHGDADAPRRRAFLSAAGIDVDRLEQRLNGGETVDLTMPGDTLPLPLAPATWLRTVFDNRVPGEALFALLIGEREALWLYCGLLGLDEETRRFLESDPALLAWIHRTRPALFGAFGRSLRVRAGRVETPGGAGDAALWESLAGASTTQPAAFARSLLQGGSGRLAWFYDTVAHLAPEPRAAVAARFEKDGAARRAWFRSLYSVFLDYQPSWNATARPFIHRGIDPSLALQLVSMKPDGRLAGPRWMAFWEQALTTERAPEGVPQEFTHLGSDAPPSVARVLGKVFAAPARQHRARLNLVLFLGRVFADIDERAAFDALVASHGFTRFPALMLVLERIGVREPAVYAAAVRAAERVASPAESRALVTRVVQLQGAVALIDRLCEVHALDARNATILARTLFAIRLGPDGWYQAAVLGWLEQQVLPALGHDGDGEAAEVRMTMALAGIPRVPLAPRPAVEWTGQHYRIDPARVVLARLLEVREKQRGPRLDTILAAWHRSAASSPPTDAAAEAESLNGSQPSTLLGPGLPESESDLRRVDHATAEWLASVAYAVRIDDVDAPVLLGTNPALTHDLRLLEPRLSESGEVSWTLPAWSTALRERTHLEGSLLGLGFPLSRYAARLKSGLPAHRPTVHERDEAVVMASVSAFNPLDVTDAERDGIAAAVRDGRAQIAALRENAGSWPSMAEKLQADEWERELVPWMLTHEPERVAARFSAHDLFTLGGGSAQGADGWGVLSRPIDGSLSLRLPTLVLRRALVNQSGVGVIITQFCDLQFRVAEFLADSRLPTSLGRTLLTMAAREFLGGARLSHDKDWPGLVVAAGAISDAQFAEYVRKLTSDGTLVREGSAAEAADRGPGPAQLAGWSP